MYCYPWNSNKKYWIFLLNTDRRNSSEYNFYICSESSSLDDDWEKEFDLEVTEEDLRLAQEAAKMLKEKGVISADADDADDVRNYTYLWDYIGYHGP